MKLSLKGICLTVIVTLSATGLRAQDFFNGGVSAQTAAHAGIYVPSSDEALDALALNPAGLSTLSGPVLNITTVGLLARGNFSNVSNQDSPMRRTASVLPYGAVGLPLGERWTVAAGFMPDLLSSANWQYRDSPGVGGADYGEQHEKSQILAFRASAGVSYRVSSYLSVGGSVSGVYNSNTLKMPYIFQSNPDLKSLKTLLDLHTTGVGWNGSLGVIARPSHRWELGASYRSVTSITSNGKATGDMGAQFQALGIPFQPDFGYKAQVKVQLPQAALLNANWRKSQVLSFSFQTDWTNWNRSFKTLPVTLTNGTNADINGFLHSTGIQDVIPLQWKDQIALRVAAEGIVGEGFFVSGGYKYQNSSVPNSTLSPLTAAIMKNALTAGAGWKRNRTRLDVAYQLSLNGTQNVSTSALAGSEFDHSQVKVGTQALILSGSFHL